MLFSNLLKVVLITIIIVSMIFGSFVVNVEKADAFAISSAAVTIIAALLIGSGIIFNNDADITSVASDFYNSLDSENSLWVDIQAGEYSKVAYGQYTFQATQGILSALGNWISSKPWDFSDVNNPVFSTPGSLVIEGIDYSWAPVYSFDSKPSVFSYSTDKYPGIFPPKDLFPIELKASDKTTQWIVLSSDESCFYFSTRSDILAGNLIDYPLYSLILIRTIDDSYYALCANTGTNDLYNVQHIMVQPGRPAQLGSYAPGSTACADVTYFPQEAVSSGVGSTEFPSNTASQPLTTDTPLTIPETGVNSTTGATDVRAPGTTSPDVPTTGFWETLWQWLQSIVDGIAGIPAAISAGVTGLIDFVKTLFDPSGFSLDFSPLKVGLTNVFPFCIPFDFLRAVQVFATDSSAFTFDIDLETEYFEIDHTVDLSPFALPIAFFRYVVVFWFGFILISRTRDFMKW